MAFSPRGFKCPGIFGVSLMWDMCLVQTPRGVIESMVRVNQRSEEVEGSGGKEAS